MPSVSEAIKADRSNLTPIDNTQQAAQKPPAALSDSRLNSLLKSPYARCPLPASNNSADSLRQWGQGTDVPTFRTQTPQTNGSQGSGSATVEKVGSSSSSSTTVIGALPTAQNASVITTALAPGQSWTGNVQMAKAFLLLNVAASAFCRVELYGTKIAQTLDFSRPVTQGPSNTTIGLILDVALLTAKSWQVLDCVGANGDTTPNSTIYVTITNLSQGAGVITASLVFVPEES